MRIYKERNGIWYLDMRPHGGRISTGTDDKRIAEEILTRKQMEAIEGRLDVTITRKKMLTLEEGINKVLDHTESKIRPSTGKRYLTSMVALIEYFGRHKPIKKITPFDLEEYRTYRTEQKVKPATINRDIQFLRMVYNRLIKADILHRNPVDRIDMLKENNIRTRVLNSKEIEKLKKNCTDIEAKIAISLALHTGMRRGEILSLELPPDDIFMWIQKAEKLKRNWIYLRKNLVMLNDTKTGRPREVPLSQAILPELMEYCKGKEPGPIFETDIRKGWEEARAKAKLDDITFHDLRRTFISMLASMGFTREIIQSICGQVSESVFRRYAHHSQVAKFDAVEKLGGVLAEEKKIIELKPAKQQ